MPNTYEEQASSFLLQVSKHQSKLIDYAVSLCRCPDTGHDLVTETLLKCHDQIARCGFYDDNYLNYALVAIRYNFYMTRRNPVQFVSLSVTEAPEQEPDENERETRSALAVGIMSFIHAHFKIEENEVFQYHVNGLTYTEIVFLTDYSWRQVRYIVSKIRKEVRKSFGTSI